MPVRINKIFQRMALAGSALLAGVAAFASMRPADQTGSTTAPPPQIRRLTEVQYQATIADIFGPDIEIRGRLEPDIRSGGLLAQGSSVASVSSAGLEDYESLARSIAQQVVDDKHYDHLIGCAPSPTDVDGRLCAAKALGAIGERLYRRPLVTAEIARYIALVQEASRRAADFKQGIAAALSGMLTSPSFLFRIDRLASGGGVARLDGWSKAVRLSYFIWNSTPDDTLLAAASNGELDKPAGLARQVDRLLASPRMKEGVRAFFSDFLRLDDLNEVSKDATIYPAFTSGVPAAAREQTERTLIDLLVDRGAGYDAVFTSRRVAINRTLSPLYGIPTPAGWSFHEFEADDPHTGLLTQIAFLAQHSHPGRSSPTLRGKALREILMCQPVPSPPANVNFAVVQDVNNPTLKTTRARLQAHLDDEECASCHKQTDPVGLSLEKFDSAGQLRERENGEPIDTRAEFMKDHYDGAAGLGPLLAKNKMVSDCLVQSVYRFGTGRALVPGDQATVEGLAQNFEKDGKHVPALFRAIATSPSFYAVRAPRLAKLTSGRKDIPHVD